METIDTCLEAIDLDKHNAFEGDILYLRNMSSIGRRHPQERYFTQYLKTKYDVTVSIDKMWVFSLDYKALTDLFQFEGTELLIIDAEGSDCLILDSMIKHCVRNPKAWPDVIQFETMGHSGGYKAENRMIDRLVTCGYRVVSTSLDTVLISSAALKHKKRLQRFIQLHQCDQCKQKGKRVLPLTYLSDYQSCCRWCLKKPRSNSFEYDRYKRCVMSSW